MKDKINKMLVESYTRKGGLPDSNMQYNPMTLSNYIALLANKANLCLMKGAIPNTNTRCTAMRSLIAMQSCIVNVAMARFHPVAEDDLEWRQTLAEISEVDKLLYKMVCTFHGGKYVRVCSPCLITNCLTLNGALTAR